MKKTISGIMCGIIAVGLLAGCGAAADSNQAKGMTKDDLQKIILLKRRYFPRYSNIAFVLKRPEKCLFCGSTDIKPIHYGIVANTETHIPGGCVKASDAPKWGCRNCRAAFCEK